MTIASLTMYKRPQLVAAHNRFWGLIRENLAASGVDAPEALSQQADEQVVWTHPDLVLSQTCGMPYRTSLHEKVQLVGTPDYGLISCPPGYYRSALVTRANEPRREIGAFEDAVFAYNQTNSQSGYAAPYWHVKPHGFWFENRLHTGQHLASAQAVLDGRADIAALDAVSWRLMLAYEPFAQDLRVLDWTDPTPGLPLITSKHNNASTIFDAVEKAIARLQTADKSRLGLRGIIPIPKEKYLAVPNPSGPGI